jgi:hypothetical protein
MSLSNYAAAAMLNSLFGKTSDFGALASRPTLYVALFTTMPDEAGAGGTEVSGGSYARVSTAPGDWDASTTSDPPTVDNSAVITFPEATGSWGTVVGFGFYDASSAGNYLGGNTFSGGSKAPGSGDTPRFNAGELDVSMD